MKKRILIVGSNGFTGRRILETLAQEPDFLVTGTSLHPDCCPQGSGYSFVVSDMTDGEAVRVVNDQWRTPVYVNDVVQGVRKLMDYPGNGIFHICGEECLSIADIAFRVADVLGLDRSLIHPVSAEEMQEKTPRPRFSGLSIEKAKRELGYRPRTLEEGIRCMFPE